MTDWYYANGAGMLLTAVTKDVYLNVKYDLVCESSDLRPAHLVDLIKKHLPAGHELDDKVRGTLAIGLLSLLRTQLKSDLAIYGPTYSGELNEYERFFLMHSGVNLRSKAWAAAAGPDACWWRLPRLRAVADRLFKLQDSSKPGLLRAPAPLLGMPAVLDVGGTSLTPPSSRLAMRNALRGSVGSAEADSGIPEGPPGDRDVEHYSNTRL